MQEAAQLAEANLNSLLGPPIDSRGKAFFIKKSEGRRLAISDIHGCYQTFNKLLQKIELTRDDQLFILGDMIDRGPYSLMVVQRIWKLLGDGYQVYPLRGNHEQLFLNYNRENWRRLHLFAERQNAGHLLKNDGELFPSVDHFFGILPFYYETEKAFLVHAGFDTAQKSPLNFWKDMIWIREFRYDEKKYKNKQIIHGHVPVEYSAIKNSIQIGARNICIDNACVRAEFPGFGRLVCLDMDSGDLIVQKNVDSMPVT